MSVKVDDGSCVGSGFCCKKVVCWEGLRVHGDIQGPCPSLTSKDGRYWCGLVLAADEAEKKRLVESLYIGAGCCSNLNSDRARILKEMGVKTFGLASWLHSSKEP